MKFTALSLSVGLFAGHAAAAACRAVYVTTTVPANAVVVPPTSTAIVEPVAASSSAVEPAALPSGQAGVFAEGAVPGAATTVTSLLASVQATTFATVTSAAAPTSVPASVPAPGSTGPKRGLSYNGVSLANLFSGKGVSWGYNWGQSSGGLSGIEFVPMLWGLNDALTGTWTASVAAAKGAGVTHLLGFNEPDLPPQANPSGNQALLTVAQSIAGYKQYLQPYAGQFKLGSVAVTNGLSAPDGSPMGVNYLKQFVAGCSGCQIDFVVMHWYAGGSAQDMLLNLQGQVQAIYDAGGQRPVWITEFQALNTDPAVQGDFLSQAIAWLDGCSMVERYAYFDVDTSLTSGGGLSALGKIYI